MLSQQGTERLLSAVVWGFEGLWINESLLSWRHSVASFLPLMYAAITAVCSVVAELT